MLRLAILAALVAAPALAQIATTNSPCSGQWLTMEAKETTASVAPPILCMEIVAAPVATPCEDAIARWGRANIALHKETSPEQLSHAITSVPTIADMKAELSAAAAAVGDACQWKGATP